MRRRERRRRRRGEKYLIRRLCNTHRNERGLRDLASHRILNATAQAKAVYLARTGRLEHGPRWFVPIQRLGARVFGWLGENIGWDDEAADVDRNWRNSPAHAANYFSTQADYLGVGRAVDRSAGRVYYVQHFAGRR